MTTVHRLRPPAPTSADEPRYTGRLSDWTEPRPSRIPADIWEVRCIPSFGAQREKKVVIDSDRLPSLPLAA